MPDFAGEAAKLDNVRTGGMHSGRGASAVGKAGREARADPQEREAERGRTGAPMRERAPPNAVAGCPPLHDRCVLRGDATGSAAGMHGLHSNASGTTDRQTTART